MAACISDSAYVDAANDQADAIITLGTIDAAIQVALALYQRNRSKSVYQMQQQIADEQMQMAEAIEAHAEAFWPEEKEYVDEMFSVSKSSPSYYGTPIIWGGFAESANATGRDVYLDTMNTLCLSPGRCDDARWSRVQGLSKIDIENFGARQEEGRADTLNNVRYARQYAALNLGRGKLAEAVSFAQVGNSAGLSAASAMQGLIGSAAGLVGFVAHNPQSLGWGWGEGIKDTWGVQSNRMPTTGDATRGSAVTVAPTVTPVADSAIVARPLE